jgi:hypothetical protein
MSEYKQDKIILYLSLPLAVLIIINSYCGLFVPGTYAMETFNRYVQAIGQDIVDLFLIVPLLLLTSLLAYKQNQASIMIWGGINVFIIYTYVIYCFDVHFNGLFLIYCFILGLSFYSFIYFLLTRTKSNSGIQFPVKIPVRTIGVSFIIIACLFYLTWLKEIVPAIAGGTMPKSLSDGGIFTNPVHVLDLSIFLPALIITAILLLKERSFSLVLTPLMLTFCILMALSISVLIIVMKLKGLAGDLSMAYIFDLISLLGAVLLVLFIKNNK